MFGRKKFQLFKSAHPDLIDDVYLTTYNRKRIVFSDKFLHKLVTFICLRAIFINAKHYSIAVALTVPAGGSAGGSLAG